jgi:YesN/AraC family two-component response regulator
VVDDDPRVLEFLAAALGDVYMVHTAASGEQACDLLRKHPIAAIILDAILGREHGLDFVERFRALSAAPILILTGYGSEDLAVRALRVRVTEYMKKPVSVVDLLAVLRRVIPQDETTADLAARAIRYIKENVRKAFRSVELANQLGVSEAHLRRCFREAHGRTPRQHVIELRIRVAAELLRTTQRSVKQIAQDVGYANGQTFRRTFVGIHGVSPVRWRLREQKRKRRELGR